MCVRFWFSYSHYKTIHFWTSLNKSESVRNSIFEWLTLKKTPVVVAIFICNHNFRNHFKCFVTSIYIINDCHGLNPGRIILFLYFRSDFRMLCRIEFQATEILLLSFVSASIILPWKCDNCNRIFCHKRFSDRIISFNYVLFGVYIVLTGHNLLTYTVETIE